MVTPEVTREKLGIVTEEEFSAAIKVTVQTLATWRSTGFGPFYIKSGRSVFYSIDDIKVWNTDNRVDPKA